MSAPRLFTLLPAHLRTDDELRGGRALEALTGIFQEELDRLESDVERLADDWFIETCQEWVVPYIGDLLGVRGLAGQPREGGFSQRAFVANTVGYRRRKGTAAVLEQLARDVTGWPARAVEFFERMVATQHVNHVRPHARATVSLRGAAALERLGGPFEEACHNAEVRHVDNGRGRYAIPHVGVFLWRLQEYLLIRSTARRVAAPDAAREGLLFTFSPLGADAPLFATPRGEDEMERLAGEPDVPGPLRRRPLFDELEARRAAIARGETPSGPWFDPPAVLRVHAAGNPVPRPSHELRVCDLSAWRLPAAGTVSVDPVRGRIAFAPGEAPAAGVEVSWAYGFPGDLGGGPYPRDAAVDEDDAGLEVLRVPSQHATPAAALAAWSPAVRPRAVVVIEDSRTYEGDLLIALGGGELTLLAADQQRPVLFGDVGVVGTGGDRLVLDGLLVAGTLSASGDPAEIVLRHCTLVPGRRLAPDGAPAQPWAAGIEAGPECLALAVRLERCITGPVRLPADGPGVEAADSILHGGTDAPAYAAEARVVSPRTGESLADALARVREAVARAGSTPALRGARVVAGAGGDVVVLSGIPSPLAAPPNTGGDLGALRLGPGRGAVPRMARVGSPVRALRLDSPAPSLLARIGDAGPFPVAISGRPRSLGDVAAALQDGLRSAAGRLGLFTGAAVAVAGRRLVVVAGPGGAAPEILPDPADPATAAALGFGGGPGAPAEALGGVEPGDPGPPATLERCTVFGAVHAREIPLASSCIFTAPVVAVRRQEGCVRFCYVPAGSQVPRPYRCQPALAVRDAIAAEERRLGVSPLPAAERERIRVAVEGRVRPDFVSVRYGNPAYAQLDAACAAEVFRGADDENEMGAFNSLQAAWRLDRFRQSLDEYLRFGLEAGVFFAT